MKSLSIKLSTLFIALLLMGQGAFAQSAGDLQYYRPMDKTGINMFEAPKETESVFDGLNVHIGLQNTMQFQGLSQSGNDDLNNLGTNFNLPTSNLDFNAQLADGVRMHLRSWVASPGQGASFHIKGGYIQFDRLDFVTEGFMEDLMDNVRIRIGHLDFNYGDAHFRRSDNAHTMHNPFVGNYIMDAYTNEIGGEVYYMSGPFLGMVGITNSRMNQNILKKEDDDLQDKPTFFGKLGYDSQVNDDLRFRLTGSALTVSQTEAVYLYGGDRAASGRYYGVLDVDGGATGGRFNPDFSVSGFAPGGPIAGEVTAFQINPFVRFRGLEFFGVIENATGKNTTEDDTRSFTQLGGELIYRFGQDDRFYLGTRYNTVGGEMANGNDIDIDRLNIGGGWFIADNIMTKLEYVSQSYDGFPEGNIRHNAEFSGIMLEAIVSF